MERNYPKIIISEQGEQWLDKGQMWMYANNLERMDKNIQNGEPVDILTTCGRFLGRGLCSLKSHITVRILSKDKDELIDRNFFNNVFNLLWIFEKL